MPRRRKTSPSGEGSSIEETLDNDLDLSFEVEEGGELSALEETDPTPQPEEDVTPVAETVEEVDVSIPSEPEDVIQEPQPLTEVVVIDVEAGIKARRSLNPKPQPKAVVSQPKSKPTPMPRRNIPRFVRK